MSPKLNKSEKSAEKRDARRPPSPLTPRTLERQRRSDEKAAALLGVERVLVDFTKPMVVGRLQQGPEQALLQKESLSLDLPRKDVRQQLHDISERPSLEAEALREEMILNDVRFDGALETDPQQRPTFDPSQLFDLTSMQINPETKNKSYNSITPPSQLSDPFDLDIESLSPRQSLRSSSPNRSSSYYSDYINPFKGEGESVKSKSSIEEPQPSSSKPKQRAKSKSVSSSHYSSTEGKRNSQEVDEIFAEFVDIDALRQMQWKKEGNRFMPSPQERDILIVIRKTMARLLALNMLTRDIQDARGLPLNNFQVPEHFYQVSDQSILQSVRDSTSSFASGYRSKPLCREYDQWAYENGTENLATLAASDCYRQYTEGWQKVFHDYGPWAWNLPDGGQLRALKPKRYS